MNDLNSYSYHIGRILKVLVYIEDHLDETLSLDKMAKLAHISPYYFHRLFRAYVGETVADHIKRLRLQRAAGRLQYTDSPITDIALDVGYESPSSFTKVFNQVMGQSPRQYRKVMQPLVQKMLQRTIPTDKKKVIKPEFVTRKEEPILFVRRIGDYQESPSHAFRVLNEFLDQVKVAKDMITGTYSIALDDPSLVDRSICRFDACVSLSCKIAPKGEVGQKILPSGRFAVFIHKGPYSEIENAYDEIFCHWYPSSNKQLANMVSFCEMVNINEPLITDEERVTKLYIPIIP